MTAAAKASFDASKMIVVRMVPLDRDFAGLIPEGSLPSSPRTDRLTSRERQVMDRISEGLSNKQIATRLGIAIHTVKCHVHNILAKLKLDNRVQVAVLSRSGKHPSWGPELMES